MSFTNIPSKFAIDDRWDCHLGRKSIESMKRFSEKVHQIDVLNEISETHGSVRLRSIRVAQALKSRGIGHESIVLLCGPNHNDICLPLFASLYIGAAIFPLAQNQTVDEWCHWLNLCKPSILFCENTESIVAEKALKKLGLSIEIVVFGNCEERFIPFTDFLKPTGTEEDFKVTEFNAKDTVAIISCTSGSCGKPKAVCLNHQQLAVSFIIIALGQDPEKLSEHKNLAISTTFWLSGTVTILVCGLSGQCRLQCPKPFTPPCIIKTIQKYKPSSGVGISTLLSHPCIKEADLSCFGDIMFLGAVPSVKIAKEVKERNPNIVLKNCYGLTECCGLVSVGDMNIEKPNCCGKILPWINWKVVDPETHVQLEANKTGELLLKGPTCFKKYFNDPESTQNSLTEDGWFKTGDLFYYDEEKNLYFLDRKKEMLKYKGYHVSPVELEALIDKLDGVMRSCVVGKPSDCGDEIMVFVERTHGSKITADDVRNAVKDNLAEWKQIRGGVAFLKSLPLTQSLKVDRKLLKSQRDSVKTE